MSCVSNVSADETMKVRLGKAQFITAKDDGGVSMFFRRDPSSSQLSRRVVLSVEVQPAQLSLLSACSIPSSVLSVPFAILPLFHPFPFRTILTNTGKTKETQERRRRANS